MAHLSNVCNVDCSLRALLLDGSDQPVHCIYDVMVIVPAGAGFYIAPLKIAPQNGQMRDAPLVQDMSHVALQGVKAGAGAMQISCRTGPRDSVLSEPMSPKPFSGWSRLAHTNHANYAWKAGSS